MACRFMDSFDHYNTASITEKWNNQVGVGTISAGTGRRGTQSYHAIVATQSIQKTFDSQASWVVGFALKFSSLSSQATVFQLLDTAGVQVDLKINTDGTLAVTRNGTAVTGGTSTSTINASVYYYIEYKCTIASSIGAGTWKVRVNGVDYITVTTGQSSKAQTPATANSIKIGQLGGGIIVDYDDLYVLDGNDSTVSGNPCNDFLGDIAVVPSYATGAGNNTSWTPDSGSNYARVNELVADGDSSWVETGSAGNIDSYAFQSLTGSPASVYAVGWNVEARKTDASTYKIRRYFQSGGTPYAGTTDYSLGTTYSISQEVLHANPATSAQWVYGDLSSPEFGVKLNSIT